MNQEEIGLLLGGVGVEGESDPTSKGFQETSLSRGTGKLRDWPPSLHPVCLSRDLRSALREKGRRLQAKVKCSLRGESGGWWGRHQIWLRSPVLFPLELLIL